MKSTFKIKGLDCANCANELESKIQKVEGVESVAISFISEKMVIEYNEENKSEIMKKIQKVIKKEEPDVSIKEI